MLSEQPSSLSLNDAENFEHDLLESRISSMPDIRRSKENLSPSEPEAVIVEVEDIIEETAAPLESYLQRQQKPVYQQEESEKLLSVVNLSLINNFHLVIIFREGQRNSSPNVRRSESTKAQTNYNLIETIIDLIRSLKDGEIQIEYVFFLKQCQIFRTKIIFLGTSKISLLI